ncbi:hypothetical protein Dtox_3564 [Desulfofarcimen acetoxidans DSM 771]|jgi:cell fate (sporulation/competence/biofilm development) regulator YlbF (YheA/YmcA/DUF963 family)|uniref:Uncharacterized protein n=1 Tax=Desulfofarcimen acetoxidans (strain ATCC 49208 / DSM 771 / KCTC 5769 / VKM B-1644 / 5575) TaxID=485916 RepID=C8VVY9_DESAS|nr:YlbF family regulator [Desulfofarcimen acetoxidans]ACV64276.1 hypothetical protein Dtox_3564 [Desulfofarcimen acetoxidans DSM 771]
MVVLDDALSLGQKLSQTSEYRAMKEAEEMMGNDQVARKAYKAYQNLRNSYQRMEQMGHQLTKENMDKLINVQLEMMKNPLVKTYTERKEDFMNLLKQVDQKISEGLTGIKPSACGPST